MDKTSNNPSWGFEKNASARPFWTLAGPFPTKDKVLESFFPKNGPRSRKPLQNKMMNFLINLARFPKRDEMYRCTGK